MAQVIKSTLTPTQTKRVNLMIRVLFSLGGISSEPFFEPPHQTPLTRDAGAQAKVVCEELLYHKFEFAKVDAALTDAAERIDQTFKQLGYLFDTIQNQPGFNAAMDSLGGLDAMKRLLAKRFDDPQKTLAEGLAKLCREKDIFWDDSRRSIYEMNNLTQYTVFGKALHDYYCFASQQDDAEKRLAEEDQRFKEFVEDFYKYD